MSSFDLYTKGTRIWIKDVEKVWKGAKLLENYSGQPSIKVETEDFQILEISFNEKNLPHLRNPDILVGQNDLTTLSYLHEPAVLHNLHVRFDRNYIYTYCGIVLVAINPYESLSIYGIDTIDAYHGQDLSSLEPHIFAMAEAAYKRLSCYCENQSLIVSGESGAGKTVSAKYAMRYLATVCGAEAETQIEKKVLASNPIMEAFGNAKTIRNDNSSRFGKYIEIGFNKEDSITGAFICTYLLEKSRVVFQCNDERNYHIFYQLCCVGDLPEYAFLCLDSADAFHYTQQGNSKIVPSINDIQDFDNLTEAFRLIGINELCEKNIFKVLAAILHLGNINIKHEGRNLENSQINKDDESLLVMSELLGIDAEQILFWICHRKITTNQETLHKPLTPDQARSTRDALAKHMYERIFNWVVKEINKLLTTSFKSNKFIGVLDIYGFETFEVNSFEQFCINYANEKLQQQFCMHVFKLEQEEYEREEIVWSSIGFYDNKPCIQLIEDKLGILDLLDDECKMMSANDCNWCQKLYDQHAQKHPNFEKPRTSRSAFIVIHFADQVMYDVKGFVDKNKDTISEEHVNILKASQYEFVAHLFSEMSETSHNQKPSILQFKSMQREMKKTVAYQFKESLTRLMEKLLMTTPHYVRCIKPNDHKIPFNFDPNRAVQQLRACGVLETIRISAAGFPSRWMYNEFVLRYRVLINSKLFNRKDLKLTADQLVKIYLPSKPKDQDIYQLGKSKIFLRAGHVAYLEKCRTERLRSCYVLIQKFVRRFIYQRKYSKIKKLSNLLLIYGRSYLAKKKLVYLKQKKAAILIQAAYRGFIQWRKFHKIKKLIVIIQTCCLMKLARQEYIDKRFKLNVTYIQRYGRTLLQKNNFQKIKYGITMLQAHVRRRKAKKIFKQLKVEARSVEHVRNIAKGLENKIIQLQHKLTKQNKDMEQLRIEAEQVTDLKVLVQKLNMQVDETKCLKVEFKNKDYLINQLSRQLSEEKNISKSLQQQLDEMKSLLNQKTSNYAIEKSTLLQELSHSKQLLTQNEVHQQTKIRSEVEKVKADMIKEFEMEREHHQKLVNDHSRLQQRYDNLKQDSNYINSPSNKNGIGDFELAKEEARVKAMEEELEKRREECIELKSILRNQFIATEKCNRSSPDETNELRMAYDSQKQLIIKLEKEIELVNQEIIAKEKDMSDQLRQANQTNITHQQHIAKLKELSSMLSGIPEDKLEATMTQEIVRLTSNNLDMELKTEQLENQVLRLKKMLNVYARKLRSTDVSDLDDEMSHEIVKDNMVKAEGKVKSTSLKATKPQNGILKYKKEDESIIIKNLITDLKPRVACQQINGLPAYLIFMCIRWTDATNNDEYVRSLLTSTINAIKKTVKKHQEDLDMMILWLSNTCRLLHNFKQYSGEKIFQEKNTQRQNEQSLKNFDLSEYRQVLSDLAVWIYQGLIKLAQAQIHPIIVGAILEHEAIAGLSGGLAGKQKPSIISNNKAETDDVLELLIKAFDKLLLMSKNHGIDSELILQIFRQIFYFVCANALNNLLLRKDMCHWTKGMQIRYNVSYIEQWLRDNNLGDSIIVCSLQPIVQASQLLQARKTEPDVDSICDMCSKLTTSQIIKILNLYTPMNEFEEKVPISFIRQIQDRLSSRNDSTSTLLLDTKFLHAVTFPFNPSSIALETLSPPAEWRLMCLSNF